MLDDNELFLQLCQKRGILADTEIAEAIKMSCSTGELRLSHSSIIASLCEIIAQVLASSSTIKVVDFGDCMLLPKGLTSILKALCEGSSVISLCLRGNNISGKLVEVLGEVLEVNSTLKILSVEWNNLGSQVDSFSKFCHGLAKSSQLEELDLRYNQISTVCADSLSDALKNNKSLKKLDLAWNSLGLSGGQKILSGVKFNRVLTVMNLKGNCVPNDIHSSIMDQIKRNQKRHSLCQSHTLKANLRSVLETNERSDFLLGSGIHRRNYGSMNRKQGKMKMKSSVREMRGSPLGDSGNEHNDLATIDRREASPSHVEIHCENENIDESLNEKIETLKRVLQERATTLQSLESSLEVKNAELALIKTENEDLKEEIENLKKINQTTLEDKRKEVEVLEKVKAQVERDWKESYKELEEENQNILRQKQEFEGKYRANEKEMRKGALEIQALKEKLLSVSRQYEDTISEYRIEVHGAKRELQEKDNRHKIEVSALKRTLKETTEALEECQDHLLKLRNELKESQENQAKLKIKVGESEMVTSKMVKISEALEKCKLEKEKLERELQESKKTVYKLQEDLIEPQKRFKTLKLELQIEREKNLRLKQEVQDERARVKEQNEQMQKMVSQINGLYTQMNEIQSNHAEILKTKDNEIEKLKRLCAEKTLELDEFRSDQIQRAHQFQAAISRYLGSYETKGCPVNK
ncbi:hypothetical protein QAD02_006683 [Eretmocerus hayati]|uniref:Uncharacterized protein n=1 Tax=Eretmocerus hayati TaxID=131215 RepID=A0ACC2N2Q9_9HYME|nr:hypothetical protein QAD02_006683 [Eretmocerus hayati]